MVSLRVGGNYYYDPPSNESRRDLLFIAGGIGINPILSMMQHYIFLQAQRSHSNKDPICQLVYSVKTSDDLVFHDELTEMAQHNDSVFVNFHVTRDQPPSVHKEHFNYHRIGRDDLELCLSRLSPTAASVGNNLSCYLCGPQHMVDEITTMLQQLGVSHGDINTEKWW